MKFLLVGSFAQKGAASVIAKGLPQRARVVLRAEPTNPYDPLAVRVFVARSELRSSDDLAEALAESGLNEAALWREDGVAEGDGADPLFPLGYLGAKAETKAAKAAIREGHQFALAAAWHAFRAGQGVLLQFPDGTKLIQTTETE